MLLKDEVEVKIGDEGIAVLREPTNKEWNNFQAAQFRGKGAVGMTTARAQLFDVIVTDIRNIEDKQGDITIEGKDRIPARIKAQCIVVGFEMSEVGLNEDEVKNE